MRDDVGQRRHVLAVEDDESTRAVYVALLGEEGYAVSVAPTPNLQPAEVATLAPDVIILDLRFQQDLDGLDFLERIKSDPRTRSIPVLVCSADHHRLDQYRAQFDRWDCRVLAKPFDLDDLIAEVRTCSVARDDAVPSTNKP